MSHKIKIDLCEVFGVEEGQEFKIDESGWKYKIENNNVFSYSNALSSWIVSCLPVNVLADSSYQIEILKPETPLEIKKMLQVFYDLGFERFWCLNDYKWRLSTKDYSEQADLWHLLVFNDWAITSGLNDGATHNIKDYI